MAVLKGAFLRFEDDTAGAIPVVVVFQFNPIEITRTPARPQGSTKSSATKGDDSVVATETGESIRFDLLLDATDQLAAGNPLAIASGILPTLSALEMLMAPKESLTLDLFKLSGADGSHQSPPKTLPLVLFFWGSYRILPVHVTSLSISESRFDTRLNPVRAKVGVSLEVLTPERLTGKFAKGVYKYTQGVKEVMAALNTANAVEIGVGSALSLSI